MPHIYGIHDEESGKFRNPQTETGRRIRHQFPDHQLPHRGDGPRQADRLHHPLHGGDRQRDLGFEALSQRKSTCRRRGIFEEILDAK